MKIIPKPVTNEDHIDKSRHVTGVGKWARSSRTIGTLMSFFAWLTIPFEVVFRRDFGQRWFNGANYLAGLLVFVVTTVIDGLIYNARYYYHQLLHTLNPLGKEVVLQKSTSAVWLIIFTLYLYMGLYHLFKIRWRNQAGIPVHSYDDGTSRFLWLGKILAWCLNHGAMPLTFIYWIMIPPKQRRGKQRPVPIADHVAFTDTTVEPLLILGLAFLTSGIDAVWLILSAIAVFIHAYWKEMARKSKRLDFQDSKVEAEIMRELRGQSLREKTIAKKEAVVIPIQRSPQQSIQYAELSVIIEEMQSERAAKMG